MAVVYMMYGLPGTGKSTHLKQLGGEYVVICPDEYLYENGVYNWSPQRVAEAWERAYEALNVAVKGHLSIVFDATFLTKAARARFMNRVKSFCPDALFIVLKLDTPVEECVRRNDMRPADRRVPKETMDRMLTTMQPPSLSEGLIVLSAETEPQDYAMRSA